MPIDIERFEEDSDADLRSGGRTNGETILAFLADHAKQAFTPKEIHDVTGIPRGSVGVVLSRLEDREMVRHRGDYWAIADIEDLDVTLSSLATARTATERLGSEDPTDWGPGVDGEDE